MESPNGKRLAKHAIEQKWSDRQIVAQKLFELISVEFGVDFDLDHDDEVRRALRIGVIAGTSTTAGEAVERFYKLMDEELGLR